MTSTQKNIAKGATVLGGVGLICKLIGAFYRIPLAWLIGESGLGTYQLVFPTYNMLLTISSAGLPVAISRMVSFCIAKNDPRNAKRIFRVALYLLTILGLISMILMMALSPLLAERVGDPETRLGFIAIAPALLLVCAMSAFRGFMQGQQNMTPTAISQLIEQIGKVAISLPMGYLGNKISIGFAAASVLLGTSIAEGIALLFMVMRVRKNRTFFNAHPQNMDEPLLPTKVLMRRLLSLAIPITLGSCIIPMASFVDSGMLLNRLMDTGLAVDEARMLYGRYSGYVLTLINVPTALATAISMSLVPAISSAIAKKDYLGVRRHGAMGIRFSFVVGLPCSIGMSMLSRQLLSMIYHFNTPEALNVTAELLSLSSLTIVLFTVVQSTTGILQGLRKQRIPMYTLVIGVAIKIFLNYTLVGMPDINIYGAPMASIACYGVSMLPNLYYVHKYARMPLHLADGFLKPLLATAGMGVALYFAIRLLPSGRLWTIVLVLIGASVYLALAIALGAIRKEEFRSLLRKGRS